MKTLNDTGKATVKDFSVIAGSNPEKRKDGSTEVSLDYSYTYTELETSEELNAKFGQADLLKLANRSLKATANSGARQTAIAPYAADPNSPDVIMARMLADLIKLNIPEDVAKGMVESARAQAVTK